MHLLMADLNTRMDTSLVYVVGATDLLGAASKVASRDYIPVEMYVSVAVIFCLTIGITLAKCVTHKELVLVRHTYRAPTVT